PVLSVATAGLSTDADFEWHNLDVIGSPDGAHEKWNVPIVPLECHGEGTLFHRLIISSIIPTSCPRGALAASLGSSYRKQGTLTEIFPANIAATRFRC
ncbi:MAG: hypothetical protein NZ768_03205, partial [Pseudomonadales bacterium]|nr:hypothetical protein [Pseudomonadales bacterium]